MSFFQWSHVLSLFLALCHCGRLKMRAGDERSLVEKEEVTPSPFHSRIPLAADPAGRPLAFSIVLTDREPSLNRLSRTLSFTGERDPLKFPL